VICRDYLEKYVYGCREVKESSPFIEPENSLSSALTPNTLKLCIRPLE
jgi:hypothetical protein